MQGWWRQNENGESAATQQGRNGAKYDEGALSNIEDSFLKRPEVTGPAPPQTIMMSKETGHKPNDKWIDYMATSETNRNFSGLSYDEYNDARSHYKDIFRERFAARKKLTGPKGIYAKYSGIPLSATQIEGEERTVAREVRHRMGI